MMAKYLRLLLILLLGAVTSCKTTQQKPQQPTGKEAKREFRGAWIQTAFQGEYKDMTPAQMRKDFIRKLNYLQKCGINAIIFQVRPEADAFHIYNKHPEWFVTYNKQILFDPGLPESRQFICRVVRDIVSRYDIDAIHMDDYFYPYPVAGMPFPDDKSFQKYGLNKGYKASQRAEWRRENVNKLIREIKRTILLSKPWVRFGISPFGIYRNKKSTPDGSGSNTNGLQNYDDLYADVTRWVKEGWIDYNIPQIYWEIGHPAADYITLIQWWNKNATREGTHLYIGQDVARTMKADQLTRKMLYERSLSKVKGNCFWPANEILWNNKGVADSLKRNYHRYPALIPAYTHLHNRAPQEVKKLKAEWTTQGYMLHWQAEQSKTNPELASYFVIYRFENKEPVNLDDPSKIVAVTRETNYLLPYDGGKRKYRYVVTAVDRFHNENQGKSKKVKL